MSAVPSVCHFTQKKRGFVHHYLITIEIPVSHSLYLAFHLTSHAPQILIPSLFRSFRVPAMLGGWAESELGIFCWKVLTATIKWLFDLQTIMELGLLTRCRGSFFPPFLPSAVQTHRNAINFSARPYKTIMVLFI